MTEYRDFIRQELIDLSKLWNTLIKDVAHAATFLDTHDDRQFARRSYVRAVAASVEGLTAFLKGLVLVDPRGKNLIGPLVSAEERLLLLEVSPRLDDKGQAQLSKQYPPVEPNLRFAIHLYARVNGIDWHLPVEEPGWASFCRAIQIRHRLMHPKRASELAVSDADLEHAKAAIEWLKLKLKDLTILILDKMASDLGIPADDIWRQLRDQVVAPDDDQPDRVEPK